jgi:hypothetical protein
MDFIAAVMKEEFGSANEQNGRLVCSFGALKRLECWLENKKLCVTTESNRDVDDRTASDTIARYNRFLERVTGYTSKERRKMAMKVD